MNIWNVCLLFQYIQFLLLHSRCARARHSIIIKFHSLFPLDNDCSGASVLVPAPRILAINWKILFRCYFGNLTFTKKIALLKNLFLFCSPDDVATSSRCASRMFWNLIQFDSSRAMWTRSIKRILFTSFCLMPLLQASFSKRRTDPAKRESRFALERGAS